MKVLAISGSLRAASINSAFCRAARELAAPPLSVQIFEGLGELPMFNPDIDAVAPLSVQYFRAAVATADVLLIASPEYAHGVSGVMKNALDWLVSDVRVVYKRVALVNTSPRAHHADESLREILRTMSTALIEAASLSIPLLGSCVTEQAMLSDGEVRAAVQRVLEGILAHRLN